jgi:hypothetical protein
MINVGVRKWFYNKDATHKKNEMIYTNKRPRVYP